MSQKSDGVGRAHSIRHRRFFGDDRAVHAPRAVGSSDAFSTDTTHLRAPKGPKKTRSKSVDHVLRGEDDLEVEKARHRAQKRLHEDAVQGLQAALAVAASASRESRTHHAEKGVRKTHKQRRASDVDVKRKSFLGNREERVDPDTDQDAVAVEEGSGEGDDDITSASGSSFRLPSRPEDQKVVVLGGVRSRPPRRGFHGRRKAAFVTRSEKDQRSVLPSGEKHVEETLHDDRNGGDSGEERQEKKEVVVRLEHLMIESEEVERVREDVARYDHVRLERAAKQSEELWKNLLHRDMIESRSVASAHRRRRMSDGAAELDLQRHLIDREKELEERERQLDAWEKDLRAREAILRRHS